MQEKQNPVGHTTNVLLVKRPPFRHPLLVIRPTFWSFSGLSCWSYDNILNILGTRKVAAEDFDDFALGSIGALARSA